MSFKIFKQNMLSFMQRETTVQVSSTELGVPPWRPNIRYYSGDIVNDSGTDWKTTIKTHISTQDDDIETGKPSVNSTTWTAIAGLVIDPINPTSPTSDTTTRENKTINVSQEVESYDDFAKQITTEYDSCIKRGYQQIGMFGFPIPLDKGNTDLMETLIKSACAQALNVRKGNHTFIDDIGAAVQTGYWGGAELSTSIPPMMITPPAFQNISTTIAIVSNPGVWTPIGPTTPIDDANLFLDILISSLTIHLTTIGGNYILDSLYPGVPPVQAPSILPFVGYTVPPDGGAAPSEDVPATQQASDSTPPSADTLSQKEIAQFTEGKLDAENIINDTTQPLLAKQAAEEYVTRVTEIISSGQHDSTPVYYSEEELKEIDEMQPDDFKCESGARVVKIARGDIGICEYKNRNYGGFGAGEQRNASGRIDVMVNTTGLNNEANVARTGKGYFWCAGATSQWWTEAGLSLPTYSSTGGPALCNRWLEWGKENGYFSSIPKEGAAILYRGGRKPGAVHIGIVENIIPGVGVGTIEGNTSGGAAFADNGGGCYRKVAKWSKGNIIGSVNPPDCA